MRRGKTSIRIVDTSFSADIRIASEGFEVANDINTRAPPLRDKWLNLVDDL